MESRASALAELQSAGNLTSNTEISQGTGTQATQAQHTHNQMVFRAELTNVPISYKKLPGTVAHLDNWSTVYNKSTKTDT